MHSKDGSSAFFESYTRGKLHASINKLTHEQIQDEIIKMDGNNKFKMSAVFILLVSIMTFSIAYIDSMWISAMIWFICISGFEGGLAEYSDVVKHNTTVWNYMQELQDELEKGPIKPMTTPQP